LRDVERLLDEPSSDTFVLHRRRNPGMPYRHLVLGVRRIAQEGDQVALPFLEDMDVSFVSCLISVQGFELRHLSFLVKMQVT
jgi:hypothetical protein